MISILFFIGCFIHAKPKYEYVRIGVVDQVEGGMCVIEIDDWHKDSTSPEMITIYSKTCKDGDIIAFGKKINETK